ncbi:2-dehydro-3-deoxyphosphooctonate aldolase [uncultured Flavobacterium sp.]|uniref:2-dehydro-3-deoxyphosphooctonate aldolase n=1 Tax=uncultured Flavobacterium sp. TaxID=165435 RepID=UPI0030C7D5CC
MKRLFLIIPFYMVISCSTTKMSESMDNTDSSYGYTKSNPIKVGGYNDGPLNERKFLNSLSGPNGESLWYERTGSCCQFKTKNSPFGMGMLDAYRVTYTGKNDTVTLYLNMYDKDNLKTPVGFKFK